MNKIKLKYLLFFLLAITYTVDAQLYFFGRNKVHYEDFDWKVISTEHFNIYYYDDFGEMAEIGAKYAEDAFDDLKVKFNHIVMNKIPLIFYNTHTHFQQTNTTPSFIPEGVGGFFEFAKGRVVIPYLSSLEQFRHVINHELVHVFMTSKIINVVRDHRVIGDRYPPLWFVEGLAEYWSYHWDTQAEMLLRDGILNNNFVPLKDIGKIRGSFLMYKEGQNFLEYVSQEYGENKILELMENFWRFKKFSEIIEFTLGEKIDVIDKNWLHYLRQKYYPLYKDKEPHFIGAKKITNQGFNFSPNYFKNKDGENVYFIANKSGYTSLYKMNYNPEEIEFAKPKILIEGEKEVIFEKFHLLKPSMTISKNGLMAFITKAGERDAIHFYSTKEEKLLNTYKYNGLLTIESPSFSDDAKKIVFSATDVKGYNDIYVLEVEGNIISRITNDYYADKDPVFNKDNSKIIFSSDRTSGIYQQKNNLFEYDIETKKINYLTYTNTNITNPKYTPDYKKLYCLADADGTKNLWEINFSQASEPIGMTQKTKFLTSIFEYTFVDETEMITSSFENFSFQFYSLKIDSILNSGEELTFSFENIEPKWEAEKITLESKKEKLKYKNQYSLDYAISQVSTDPVFGTRGGGIVSLSDILGDDRYSFLFFNNGQVQSEVLKNLNVAVSRVNSGDRTNFGYGLFHFTGRRYDLRTSSNFFLERSFGGFISLRYPLSFFQRFETSVTLANSDRELISDLVPREALLLSNSISYTHDNSIWGPTGPVDGTRLRLLLGYTTDIQFSNANFYSVIADYRKYFRLSQRMTLATRGSFYYNEGKEARRYIAGGSWNLRGWKRFGIRGEKMWLSSVELRFPFIDRLYLKLPFLGLDFSRLRGAIYFDAGSAWDEKYDETLGSIGVGIRFNLLGAITLRYDVGKKIVDDFQRLQNNLFYQFFFGWDF